MATIEELERRVIALESAQKETAQTLNWLVGTTGRIAGDLAAFRDETSKRFDKVDTRFNKVESDIAGIRRDLPAIVIGAVREALSER